MSYLGVIPQRKICDLLGWRKLQAFFCKIWDNLIQYTGGITTCEGRISTIFRKTHIFVPVPYMSPTQKFFPHVLMNSPMSWWLVPIVENSREADLRTILEPQTQCPNTFKQVLVPASIWGRIMGRMTSSSHQWFPSGNQTWLENRRWSSQLKACQRTLGSRGIDAISWDSENLPCLMFNIHNGDSANIDY